jgi:ATP-dependent DNA helicase DinG
MIGAVQPTADPTVTADGTAVAADGTAVATAADRAETWLARVTDALPNGEPRPQQVVMARSVAAALAGGRHLVVQAGTGTGKSLAYVVPALASGKKVVIATATKALQDQLAQKDLPIAAAALPGDVTFSVLKGRSNYLCRQRAAEMEDHGHQPALDVDATESSTATELDSGRLVDQVRRLLEWSEETATGDRGDLPFEPHERAWAMVSVGPRECPGAYRCPSGGRCFAEQARAEAQAADVVVVNTHLYGAHLASGGAVLPEHDVVVFDEAHEVEEIMTASLGAEITPGRFRALQAVVRPLLRDDIGVGATADLGALANRLQLAIEGRVGTRVLDGTTGTDVELVEVLEQAASQVDRTLARLRRTPDANGAAGETAGPDDGRRARAVSAAGHLVDDLARLAGRSDDEVAWVDGTTRSPVLRLSPIDVGPPLAERLWGEVTAVLTSATIPPRLPERLGLRGFAVDEEDVGSPFDYRSHAMLYVARHLPDRRRPESEAALHTELRSLIAAAGGRTLALFTSRRATDAAADALAPDLPFRLLVQGQLPKGRLLEAFSAEETSCLFATLGFWQGVDVPGRSLSLVTLDRLPFARPDDPLLQARRDRAGDAAFSVVDLPRAATLLAQGAGRLIRSADDYGVVAVLDPRLATAGYRHVLLAALPPMRRSIELAEVEEFFGRVLADQDQ